MKKYIILIAIVITGYMVNAQTIWNLTYNMGVSLGETNDFISAPSFRGFGLDGRSFVNDNVTLGGSWTWNVFYESEMNITTTSEDGATTITGNHYDYGNYMPLMFNGHYYFGEDGGVRPFVGTGIGVIWKEERKDIGGFNSYIDNAWQFGVTPEIGVFVPVGTTLLVFINAKYVYGVNTTKLTPTSYLSFGIGLAWENF